MKMSQAEWQILLNRLRDNDPTLTDLSLIREEIGDTEAQALASALKGNDKLRSLNLRLNQISDVGAKAISSALYDNQTLQLLELSYNQIGSAGAEALAVILKNNFTLASFNLASNKIGDKGTQAIAFALAANHTLKRLVLLSNEIGNVGAQALAFVLKNNPSLMEVELSFNKIGDEGIKALALALETNHLLISIGLSQNKIGDGGAKALANALSNNRILSSLDLSDNEIDTDSAQALLGMLHNNYTLTYLYLGWSNRKIAAIHKQIALLIKRNVDLRNSFYEFIKQGNLSRVEWVVKQGTSLLPKIGVNEKNGADQKENTPLHWAVINGHKDIANFLIRKMKEQLLPLNTLNAEGKTAEQLAAGTPLASLFESTATENSASSIQAISRSTSAIAESLLMPDTSTPSSLPKIPSAVIPVTSSSSSQTSPENSPLSVGQLPISTSKPFSGKSSNAGFFQGNSAASFSNDGDEGERLETGRKGEAWFYQHLLKHTKVKFPRFQITEDDEGFKVKNEKGQIFLKVDWLNKVREQRQRRDILVTFEGKEYVFEIKTTKGKVMNAFISRAEVEELKAKKENYALVFISDINGSPIPFIQWNPNRKIAEGVLELIPVSYAIYSSGNPPNVIDLDENDLGPEEPPEYSQCQHVQ